MGLETSLCEPPSRWPWGSLPGLPSVSRSAGHPRWLFWGLVLCSRYMRATALCLLLVWQAHSSGDGGSASLRSGTINKALRTVLWNTQGVLNPSLDGLCCCWRFPLLNLASFMWPVPRDLWGCRACWFLKNEKQNTINILDSQGFACFIFIRLPRRQSLVFGKQQCEDWL